MTRTVLLKIEPPSAPISRSLLWRVCMAHWKTLLALGILGSILGVVISFLFKREYRAEAVAVYVQTSPLPASLQSIAGGLGGLASLAGINISTGDNSALARTMLDSKLVSQQLISQYNLMPQLFPWDWDEKSGKWKGDKEDWPTIQQAVDKFQKKHLSIDYDNLDNKVTVGVLWWDPVVAAQVANSAVAVVNESIRAQAQQEAARTSAYLRDELNKTSPVEMRAEIFAVMRQQMETSMYATVRTEYALKAVDPAVAPDINHAERPNRLEFALLGGVGVFAIGVLVFVRRHLHVSGVAI